MTASAPPDRTFPTPNPTTGKTHVAEEKKFHEGGNLKAYAHEELREDGQTFGRASDPVKYYLGIEQRARERQVAYETVRLLREDVIECYRKNGVNHYTECHAINQKYYDIVIKKDMGQLHPTWKDEAKHDGW